MLVITITPSLAILAVMVLAAAFGLGILIGCAMNAPYMPQRDEHADVTGQGGWSDRPGI